jgi:hypothetical protein
LPFAFKLTVAQAIAELMGEKKEASTVESDFTGFQAVAKGDLEETITGLELTSGRKHPKEAAKKDKKVKDTTILDLGFRVQSESDYVPRSREDRPARREDGDYKQRRRDDEDGGRGGRGRGEGRGRGRGEGRGRGRFEGRGEGRSEGRGGRGRGGPGISVRMDDESAFPTLGK